MECRKHQIILISQMIQTSVLFFFLMLLPGRVYAASQLTAIDFYGIQDPNRIEIRSNGPVTFENRITLKIGKWSLNSKTPRFLPLSVEK
jgi:hypothetical protein